MSSINNVQWEYCAIRTNLDGSFKKVKYFSTEGKHQAEEISDPHLTIAKLGLEGWEMVTLAQILQPDARVYYFKRQI